MARTYTEGFRKCFLVARKDLSKKKTVSIRFHIGFERMIRAAILQFREMGLEPVISRGARRTGLPVRLRISSMTTITGTMRRCISTRIS